MLAHEHVNRLYLSAKLLSLNTYFLLLSRLTGVAGTFWGELGFFKLEMGVNTLQIESGDCWYAEPEYKLEKEVREGELVGSMYGLIPRNHSASHLSIA